MGPPKVRPTSARRTREAFRSESGCSGCCCCQPAHFKGSSRLVCLVGHLVGGGRGGGGGGSAAMFSMQCMHPPSLFQGKHDYCARLRNKWLLSTFSGPQFGRLELLRFHVEEQFGLPRGPGRAGKRKRAIGESTTLAICSLGIIEMHCSKIYIYRWIDR